ncbi:hypothetical protein REPUB_Repub12eG0150500 [Reevesia pubescens]
MNNNNNAGGNRINGVVVLGGALAIASLVAAFTIKKGNRKDSNKDTTNLEENTMQCERKDSVSGHQETLIHDTEQESIAMTGDYGDIEEISQPLSDHKSMNVDENESNDPLVMETIEIEIEDER